MRLKIDLMGNNTSTQHTSLHCRISFQASNAAQKFHSYVEKTISPPLQELSKPWKKRKKSNQQYPKCWKLSHQRWDKKYQPSSARTPPLFQFVPSVKLQKKRSCSTINCGLSNIKTLTRPGGLLLIKMRVVKELPVPFLPLTGLSLYLPNGQSIKEKFPLARVFLFWHGAGTQAGEALPAAARVGKECQPHPCEQTVYHWHQKAAGMGGLGPSTAKRGCLAWQWEEKGMPQGCPNLCYWHGSLGRAHCLELAERPQSSIFLSPNDSSICHRQHLMDNENK